MASFRDQLKSQISEADWKKARRGGGGGGRKGQYDIPDIDDGDYVCRVNSFECRVTPSKNIPIVEAKMVVTRGDYEGTQLTKTYFLNNQSASFHATLGILTSDIQTCDPSTIDVLSEVSRDEFFDELEGICTDIGEIKPLVRCGVRNKTVGGTRRLNIYINDLLDDDEEEEAPPKPKRGRPKKAVKKEEVEEEEEKEEEEEQEEDEENMEIDRGMFVSYKAPRGKYYKDYQVTAVNKRLMTAKIREVDGDNAYNDVPWKDLTVFTYEEDEKE